jgi:ribosomal protein L15E
MNCNYKTVPYRPFYGLSWASMEQLVYMLEEIEPELKRVHRSVVSLAARRNGYAAIEREIALRLQVGLAKDQRRERQTAKAVRKGDMGTVPRPKSNGVQARRASAASREARKGPFGDLAIKAQFQQSAKA